MLTALGLAHAKGKRAREAKEALDEAARVGSKDAVGYKVLGGVDENSSRMKGPLFQHAARRETGNSSEFFPQG